MTTHSRASSLIDRNSFAELDARARVRTLLDASGFRELIEAPPDAPAHPADNST